MEAQKIYSQQAKRLCGALLSDAFARRPSGRSTTGSRGRRSSTQSTEQVLEAIELKTEFLSFSIASQVPEKRRKRS